MMLLTRPRTGRDERSIQYPTDVGPQVDSGGIDRSNYCQSLGFSNQHRFRAGHLGQ